MAKKLTESSLRSMIRTIIREETEYQKFFNKALAKFKIKSPITSKQGIFFLLDCSNKNLASLFGV